MLEVERKFGLAKLKCGLEPVKAMREDIAEHVAAMSILLLNLCKVPFDFFKILFYWLDRLEVICK